jgi:hypothetical protein
MQDYEKLGVFYLGREYDLAAKSSAENLILYDSKDLVTHAVCVGMTGSGKTGLCIGLLEEAAIDGIPALIIDPKGDLSNLLLTFPNLEGADFKPWVNTDDARKKGLDVDAFAEQQADLWKTGLGQWHQTGDRIQKLKDSADFAIYTPGSSAGIPISIIKSFAVPEKAILDDGELLRERVGTTATSLLGLLGIDADPIQSREHIFLSNLIANAWQNGKDLDLASLIQHIQQPPMDRIGVMDLESFYPQKDRFTLAMQLNNLLAAPGFQAWMEGVPLDIQSLLYTPHGKPRHAIISIAHLGDSERMFFVSLLLNQVLGWMRMQGGTTSLRAILYMDEIFGYFPPVANPPSKQPLLTLLKQARAFGLGICLATQNPVDLDYKGLSNCGTWFIGRLQTERDKQRVLEGLEGAAAGASQKFDRAKMEQTLAGLGSRVFLMNNVHDDAPVTFETRWCLSYLRGPLGRNEIRTLMENRKPDATPVAKAHATQLAATARPLATTRSDVQLSRPLLPPEIKQYFIPVRGHKPDNASLEYEPYLLGTADVFFYNKKHAISIDRHVARLAAITDGPVPVEWDQSAECVLPEDELESEPFSAATFGQLPSAAMQGKRYDAWSKSLVDYLYRTSQIELLSSEDADIVGAVDESERDFRARLAQVFREERDAVTGKLRAKYASKFNTLQERIRKAEQAVKREQEEASSSKWTSVLQVGASLMGALLGRKKVSAANAGRVVTASRSVGRSMKQASDVERAEENLTALQQQLAELEQAFNDEVAAATQKLDATTVELTELVITPRKMDVKPRLIALAWVPHWRDANGKVSPAWE